MSERVLLVLLAACANPLVDNACHERVLTNDRTVCPAPSFIATAPDGSRLMCKCPRLGAKPPLKPAVTVEFDDAGYANETLESTRYDVFVDCMKRYEGLCLNHWGVKP